MYIELIDFSLILCSVAFIFFALGKVVGMSDR
jgi:hypothetical protein